MPEAGLSNDSMILRQVNKKSVAEIEEEIQADSVDGNQTRTSEDHGPLQSIRDDKRAQSFEEAAHKDSFEHIGAKKDDKTL